MLALPSGVVRASHLHATKKTAVALNPLLVIVFSAYISAGVKTVIHNLVVMSSKMNSKARMQDDMHRNILNAVNMSNDIQTYRQAIVALVQMNTTQRHIKVQRFNSVESCYSNQTHLHILHSNTKKYLSKHLIYKEH